MTNARKNQKPSEFFANNTNTEAKLYRKNDHLRQAAKDASTKEARERQEFKDKRRHANGAYHALGLLASLTFPFGIPLTVLFGLGYGVKSLSDWIKEHWGEEELEGRCNLEPARDALKDCHKKAEQKTNALQDYVLDEFSDLDEGFKGALSSVPGIFAEQNFLNQFVATELDPAVGMSYLMAQDEKLKESRQTMLRLLEDEREIAIEKQSDAVGKQETNNQFDELKQKIEAHFDEIENNYHKVKWEWLKSVHGTSSPWQQRDLNDSDVSIGELDPDNDIVMSLEVRKEDINEDWTRDGDRIGNTLASNVMRQALIRAGGVPLRESMRIYFKLKTEEKNGKKKFKMEFPDKFRLSYIQLTARGKMDFWEAAASTFLQKGQRCVDPLETMSIEDSLLAATGFLRQGAYPSDKWFKKMRERIDLTPEQRTALDNLYQFKQELKQNGDLGIENEAKATAEIQDYAESRAIAKLGEYHDTFDQKIRESEERWNGAPLVGDLQDHLNNPFKPAPFYDEANVIDHIAALEDDVRLFAEAKQIVDSMVERGEDLNNPEHKKRFVEETLQVGLENLTSSLKTCAQRISTMAALSDLSQQLSSRLNQLKSQVESLEQSINPLRHYGLENLAPVLEEKQEGPAQRLS